MKILFLNHNIKNVGTFIRCFCFAKHLVRFGHTVTILTSTPRYILHPMRETKEGVRVVCMPDIVGKRFRNGGLGPIDTFFRSLFLIQNHFDIVENFDHRPAVLVPALAAKYLYRLPLVSEWTDLHGTGGSLSNRPEILQKLIGPYENFSERHSKLIPEKLVVISKGLKQRAMEIGVPESKIVYIPGGSDLDRIKNSRKQAVREHFGLPIDKTIIAYSAGTQYNLSFLIEAVNLIQASNENVLLLTTGATLTDTDKKKFIAPQRIMELGFLSYEDYTAVLPAADIFIFPFVDQPLNTGRWPNKIGDYMAAGRPTVTNRTGDLIDLFEKHQIGLLSSDNPQDFANKTLQLISDEHYAVKLGENARKTAEACYDWKFLAKKLYRCFDDVLKSRR